MFKIKVMLEKKNSTMTQRYDIYCPRAKNISK